MGFWGFGADMLDEEMKDLLSESMEIDVPVLFFSSIAEQGLVELKDKLWEMMQS